MRDCKKQARPVYYLHEKRYEWGFKAGFIYSTKAVEKLGSKKFRVYCYDAKSTVQSSTSSSSDTAQNPDTIGVAEVVAACCRAGFFSGAGSL